MADMEKIKAATSRLFLGKQGFSFVLIFAPFFLLCVSVLGVILYYDSLRFRENLSDQEQDVINLLTSTLQSELNVVQSDLLFLAQQPDLEEVILGESSPGDLEQVYADFLVENAIYLQVRLADTEGNELLNVKYRDGIASIYGQGDLENISDRYYFQQAIGLKPGETYVSPLDLSTDGGFIEEPYRPTIRFETTLFDNDGTLWGLLILNFNAAPLLNLFDTLALTNKSETSLLNANGFFLTTPDPEDEWGFMWPDRSDRNLAIRNPGLWNLIKASPTSSLFQNGDLYSLGFICEDIDCLGNVVDPDLISSVPFNTQDFPWIIVSRIPADEISTNGLLRQNMGRLLPIALLLALLALSGGYFAWRFSGSIASLKRREEQISRYAKQTAESEQRFRKIIETAVDAILMVDTGGNIKMVNEHTEELFGYSEKELLDMNVDALVPEAGRAAHKAYRESYFQNPTRRAMSESLDLQGVRADGGFFPIDVALSPISFKGENMVTCVVRDMTEARKQMKSLQEGAKKLEQLNAELQEERQSLEARVAKRTEQLEEAKQSAEDANRAKSSFLATMSHEIRTPMNGIIGTIDIMMQSSLKPRQMELAGTIRDSAYSLLTVIDDILDFSKIEAGKVDVEKEPLQLNYLLESVCNAMEPIADKYRVKLSFYQEPGLPATILSDSVRLRQIIINLTNNAIKFSGNREGLGRVKVHLGKNEDGSLEIAVMDNGIGMNEETVNRIFESFTQADSSTTRRFGGTGLGLPICKRLTEMMGGSISVESTINAGSTFTIQLPLEAVDKPEEPHRLFSDPALKDVHCFLYAERDDEAQDCEAWLLHTGLKVTRLTSPYEILAENLVGIDGGKSILLCLDDSRDVDEYESLGKRISPGLLEKIILVSETQGERVSFRNDLLVLVEDDPNFYTKFKLVCAVICNQRSYWEEDDEDEDDTEVIPELMSREQAAREGRLVLVAEDNDINQKVISTQLEFLHYAYDIASDGQEALEMWRNDKYSLLLSDLHMPVLDGYQLARSIRLEEKNGSHMPIIAFTANASKGEKARCLEMGMDDYLTKPIRLEKLKEALNLWTAQSVQEGSLETLDLNEFAKNIGDGYEVKMEFLNDFRDSLLHTKTEVDTASNEGNGSRLAELAHTLKSSSRSVGAMKLGQICADLELAGKTGNDSLIISKLTAFNQEVANVLNSISAEVERK